MRVGAFAVAMAVAALPWPLAAQQTIQVQQTLAEGDPTRLQVASPILVLDEERLFSNSQTGQRVLAEIEAAGRALQDKNDRIARELEAEEQELTQKRAEIAPEEFRTLADAFDDKAERIRAERAAELRALNVKLDEERRRFLQNSIPVLEAIMREAGAAVILNQREVFLSSLAVDITDVAIARVNAASNAETGQD